jgi:hypothetical protein
MFAALRPLFVQFSAETTRTLETFGKLNVPHPVEQIYGLGGGFQTPGLLRQLRMGSSS